MPVTHSEGHASFRFSIDTLQDQNGGPLVPFSNAGSQPLAGLAFTGNPPSPQINPRGRSRVSAPPTPPEPSGGPARLLQEGAHPSTLSTHSRYSHDSPNRGDEEHPKERDSHILRLENTSLRENIEDLTKKNAELSSTVEALSSQNAILSSRMDDMFVRLEALAASSSASLLFCYVHRTFLS